MNTAPVRAPTALENWAFRPGFSISSSTPRLSGFSRLPPSSTAQASWKNGSACWWPRISGAKNWRNRYVGWRRRGITRSTAVATPHNSPLALRAMHTACGARSFARSASGIAPWRTQNSTSSACSSGDTLRQTCVVVNAFVCLRATSLGLRLGGGRGAGLRLRGGADELHVFLEVQALVLVRVEGRHHRSVLAGVLHERELCVFAGVQAPVVVGVAALELDVQALQG